MTTIACNLKCMAADRRITGDVMGEVDKMFRFGDVIIGCAGDWETILVFREWVMAGMDFKKRPVLGDGDFEALMLTHEGIWVIGKGLRPYPNREEFHAIGNGALAAKAVMHIGHHPQVAVQTASRVDECTGPEVDVLELKPRKRKR